MQVDSLYESVKINPEADKALVIVHSQVPNLKFDSNRKIEKVNKVSSGDWELWLPAGTHILKVDAEGYQRLELAPYNFARKRTYELKIVAVGFAPTARSDENLFELTFRCNEDSVYSSYGDFAPMLSKGKVISYKLPRGEYTFRFRKKGFDEEIRSVKVNQSAQSNIALKPSSSVSSLSFSLPGMIVIASEPTGAEIILDGQKIGTTTYQGELTAGNHQLELRKPLFYPNISTFSLQEGKTQSLSLNLKPRFGYLTVASNVQNSRVVLDGKPIGAAPIAKKETESTKHSLRVELDLYHPYIEEFTLRDGEEKKIMVALEPAFGSLEVTSLPEGDAGVFLDGQKVGVTPYANSKLSSGKYILKVQKQLFNDVEEEIVIADKQSVKKAVTLPKNFGELIVKAPQSTIYVNGATVGTDVYRGRLAPGRYELKATRGTLYIPAEKEEHLSVGEEKEIVLEPKPRLGSLSVLVEPLQASDAEIYVGSELKGKAPLVFALLLGDYNVTARRANFLDVTQTVTIKENEKSKLVFTMLTYEGSLQATRDKWGTAKTISLAATALAAVAGAYCYYQTQVNYDHYKAATTSNDAENYRKLTERNNTYYTISVSVAGVAAVSSLVSRIAQGTY